MSFHQCRAPNIVEFDAGQLGQIEVAQVGPAFKIEQHGSALTADCGMRLSQTVVFEALFLKIEQTSALAAWTMLDFVLMQNRVVFC